MGMGMGVPAVWFSADRSAADAIEVSRCLTATESTPTPASFAPAGSSWPPTGTASSFGRLGAEYEEAHAPSLSSLSLSGG